MTTATLTNLFTAIKSCSGHWAVRLNGGHLMLVAATKSEIEAILQEAANSEHRSDLVAHLRTWIRDRREGIVG